LGPTAIAEANAQQAFVDILDNDVIEPLSELKVSQEHLVREGIPVLIRGRFGRKRKMRQESGLKKISINLPRNMPIMQRTECRGSSRHTWRDITLGNVLTLPTYFNVLRTFQTKGFAVGGKICGNLSLPSLKKVSPISPMGSNSVY